MEHCIHQLLLLLLSIEDADYDCSVSGLVEVKRDIQS